MSGKPKKVRASDLNRALEAGRARAVELEERLVEILTPILQRAGARAAGAFQQSATDHLRAAAGRRADLETFVRTPRAERRALLESLGLVAAGPLRDVPPNATMVAVKPRPDEAAAIADPEGTPAEYLHVTLASLGEVEGTLGDVVEAVKRVAANHAPLVGRVGGYGTFQPPGCGVLLPDVPGLVELRVAVTTALVDAGIGYARDHGFEAHLTVDGEPEPDDAATALERAAGAPLHFDAILVVRGDSEVVELPLVGIPPVTAAGTPPQWTPPAPDELLDVAALVAEIRAKTDPVRVAFVEAVMTSALELAGLSWDTTNPLTAAVLAKTGAYINEIADTSRVNVMRIIAKAYEQGLTIPDTAKLIEKGFSEASIARARMIARTELASAVNGGSLAAVQTVSAATETPYIKAWLTAPGAPHPRHEDYEGLDGQTVALDDYFDVRGNMMPCPGDGPADEVINCRCSMAYSEGTVPGVSGNGGLDADGVSTAGQDALDALVGG